MKTVILLVTLLLSAYGIGFGQTQPVQYKANHYDVILRTMLSYNPQTFSEPYYDHTEDMLRFKNTQFTAGQAVAIYGQLRAIPSVSNVRVMTNGVILYNTEKDLTAVTSTIVGGIISPNARVDRVGKVAGWIDLITFEDNGSIATRWRLLSDK